MISVYFKMLNVKWMMFFSFLIFNSCACSSFVLVQLWIENRIVYDNCFDTEPLNMPFCSSNNLKQTDWPPSLLLHLCFIILCNSINCFDSIILMNVYYHNWCVAFACILYVDSSIYIEVNGVKFIYGLGLVTYR